MDYLQKYGYTPAEDHPDTFHGIAPFYIESGERTR